MAWVPVLVVVVSGATAAAACVLRGRREPAGSRAPWFVLAAAIALQAARVVQPGSLGISQASTLPI